jgi:dual specificity phosphatase 12
MFYLERAVEEVLSDLVSNLYLNHFMLNLLLDGDGSVPETDMFAKFPRTPTDSAPATPGGPRRRIRCKMCR